MNYLVSLTTGWGTEGSVIARALAIVVLLIYVIPLQIQESKVKNGLYKLRLQMLLAGVSLLIMMTITQLVTIQSVIRKVNFTPESEFLQFVNALGFLVISVIFYLIYHQQFSTGQKVLHVQIDKLEKKKIASDDIKRIKYNKSRRVVKKNGK